jgi:hypothetical protein
MKVSHPDNACAAKVIVQYFPAVQVNDHGSLPGLIDFGLFFRPICMMALVVTVNLL